MWVVTAQWEIAGNYFQLKHAQTNARRNSKAPYTLTPPRKYMTGQHWPITMDRSFVFDTLDRHWCLSQRHILMPNVAEAEASRPSNNWSCRQGLLEMFSLNVVVYLLNPFTKLFAVMKQEQEEWKQLLRLNSAIKQNACNRKCLQQVQADGCHKMTSYLKSVNHCNGAYTQYQDRIE